MWKIVTLSCGRDTIRWNLRDYPMFMVTGNNHMLCHRNSKYSSFDNDFRCGLISNLRFPAWQCDTALLTKTFVKRVFIFDKLYLYSYLEEMVTNQFAFLNKIFASAAVCSFIFIFPIMVFAGPVIIDHNTTDLALIPQTAIEQAKSELHIAYGHTSIKRPRLN